MEIKVNNANEPVWGEMSIKTKLPPNLEPLNDLAQNVYWSWNHDVRELFKSIDPTVWSQYRHNPKVTLDIVEEERFDELANDKSFCDNLDKVYRRYLEYKNTPFRTDTPSIAYFSMEYGLTDHLKIYSGGLGVLAGDYLKEASDSRVNMVAVGFLYRYGYFTQSLSVDGQQIADYEAQNFSKLAITQVKDEHGNAVVISVPFPNRMVYSNIWRVDVGRIPLYLLDTDIDINSEEDRTISYQLYGGDNENRLKQEIILGIGGILALQKLGIKQDVYHCNEGHAALINLQRLVDYVENNKLSIYEALEVVRSSSIYTVHTPVPAGHDYFDEELFNRYMHEYPSRLGITWNDLINMGRNNPDTHDKFSMSVFACNTCQCVNGVSYLHGEVSKRMFAHLWKGYFPEENHVGYVTNGVHLPTWTTSEWKTLYENTFTTEFYKDQSNLSIWAKIYDVPDKKIWYTKIIQKDKLIKYIRTRFEQNWLKTQQDPSKIVSILNNMNPDALIVGFGRRFATYKRAHLLFNDLERLDKIVNNPKYPVQFLFTGKAHPADEAGQELIKHIIEISRMPQFLGKIIFLENYDMRLAKRLVSGVDIWLNTPTRMQEASGTSGEKAQMNGVLNFSVKDGWWYEGYTEEAGWALTEVQTYENTQYQDHLDAATIYTMLENEIVPLFFDRNKDGIPEKWVRFIKNSIAKITPRYTTKRMIDDYIKQFYSVLADRNKSLKADNFQKARRIVAWKMNIVRNWDSIEVKSLKVKTSTSPTIGDIFEVDAVVDTKNLNDTGIGLELVLLHSNGRSEFSFERTKEFNLVRKEGSLLYFTLNYSIKQGGTYRYAFRLFPKNDDLPYREDMCYVKWVGEQ
ncbi:MAG: alpha-glucan family phosphorylase [Bacteroidota bacterium]